MNQTDFAGLIARVTDSTGKTITDKQIGRLHAEFNRIGLNKANEVVRRVERMQSLPNNIVGLVLNIIDEVNDEFNKKLDNANKWKTDELCTSPDDFEMFFKIIGLIMKLHADDVVKRNDTPECTGPDLETWHNMGCKKTWSPLVDSFLLGYITVYKNDKACTKYMREFYTFLVQMKNRKDVPDVQE